MFHIFYLNRGYMLRFEAPSALGSIYDIQKCVANSISIDTQDQFLFLSGGASLSPSTMLSSSTISGFGTDANPIFLVRRVSNVQPESNKENTEGINELYQGWISGMERLDRISTNSSSVITECVELGKKCSVVAETIVKFCSNIISEHNYLYQGWLAVIANLDDNVQKIQKRLDRSLSQAEKLETIQEKGRELLADFDAVIETLSKIIIPPTLLSPIITKNLTDSIDSADEMSLYDWISSKDQAYSLDSLAQHVLDHLDRTDDSDLREAQAYFSMVNDVAKKSQYRDIGGIDKRLSMLNSKLQHLEECLLKVRESTSRIMQPVIQDSTQNVAIFQKQLLGNLRQPMKTLYDYALSFINSKEEVVKNISQRFSTWIRQAYQRLHECTKKIVIFEEKYMGLRQRLDLARQIKEAPNIYMMTVPEVIRREELKKEFSDWVKLHIDKCSSFIREENRIREEFQSKLEKHFLCQLFAGMGDRIPQFTVQTPPKIDQNLPRISTQHLIELRKTFPNKKELLIVLTPRIFPRLAIADPMVFPSMAMGQSSQLRREQSFYDRDRTSNMDAMNRNFPSTNWLIDENMELVSPSTHTGNNFLGMARTASLSASTSIAGLHQMGLHQSPPQELGPLGSEESTHFSLNSTNNIERLNRGSISPLQPSAPISIPNATAIHGDLIESLGSNHFSTPEEFGSFDNGGGGARFIGGGNGCIPPRSTFPNNAFRCSPKITRPLSLMRANQPAVLLEEFPKKNEASQTTTSTIFSPDNKALESKLLNMRNELKEIQKTIPIIHEFGMQIRHFSIPLDLSQLMHRFENIINKKVAIEIENYKRDAENEQQEKIEKLKASHFQQINQLNAEIEEERRINENKDREIIELQTQIETLNKKINVLENERANKCIMNEPTENSKAKEENIEKKPNSSMQIVTEQMDMGISQSMIEINDEQQSKNHSSPASDEEEGIARINSRSCCTQTKIRSKDMAHFVSLNEIYEGFGALIIWNGQMNAFMAHCSNPKSLPYLVKESCLERLNIRKPPKSSQESGSMANATPQRTWAFVIVETIEPCQIRKMSNRYNLPLDTRFFRISVKPMLGDFGSVSSNASSIASSKR